MISITDLQSQHNSWCTYNFGNKPNGLRHHLMGLVEESGELCHAMLKKEQGIRGTPEQHDAKAKDAIGDLVIYGLGTASLLDIELGFALRCSSFYDLQSSRQSVYTTPLSKIALFAATALDAVANGADPITVRCHLVHMFEALADFCASRGWSLQEIAQDTWNEVGKRDWVKYPETGMPT